MIALLRTCAMTTGLLLLLCACPAPQERPGVPPDVALLITVAGLRADHTSMLLYPLPTTELGVDGGQRAMGRALGLDDLAAEGVLFANAFAPSADPLISLGALHTARSPLASGVRGAGTQPDLEEVTLAEGLAAEGFDTVAFVSHAQESLGPGWQQGFQHFAQYEDDRTTLGALITWLGDRDFGRGKPLLLWVHLEGPRFPFEPGVLVRKDFAHLFTDPGYDGPATGSSEFRESVRRGELVLDQADRDQLTALYDGEVAQVTELLFRFFDTLRYESAPSGVLDRTLLVFAGTGGPTLPHQTEVAAGNQAPGSWGAETGLVDGTLRVPLFMRHPDSLTGRRIFERPVELQDLAPTLWDLFDCGAPEAAEGRSLLAITDSFVDRGFSERPLFAMAPDEAGVSVRDEGWRLVRRRGAPERLIHAEVDPHSLQDESPRRPQVLQRLREQIDAWVSP